MTAVNPLAIERDRQQKSRGSAIASAVTVAGVEAALTRYSRLMRISTRHRAEQRAFTLLELLTVVTIVGVLATLGLVSYRRFITSSKSSEAIYMVGSIRAAQESYRAETLSYLDVSAGFNEYFPTSSVGAKKTGWDAAAHKDYTRWRQLGARPDGAVYYGYLVGAGVAGAAPPALHLANKPTWATTTEPWYVIEAKGDVDGNGIFSWVAGSSFTGEIYLENQGQ
jgi:prepilin-type N-terminal cleavage/methylation domain-containing protein